MTEEIYNLLNTFATVDIITQFSFANMPVEQLRQVIGEQKANKIHAARKRSKLTYKLFKDTFRSMPEYYRTLLSSLSFDIKVTGISGKAVYSRRIVLGTNITHIPFTLKARH